MQELCTDQNDCFSLAPERLRSPCDLQTTEEHERDDGGSVAPADAAPDERTIKVPQSDERTPALSILVPALLASHTVSQSSSTLMSGVKASAILGENRKVM